MGAVVNIGFVCPECSQPSRWRLPSSAEWQCPTCDHLLHVPAAASNGTLSTCLICGNAELYRRKNFPQALGLTVLAVACASFLIASLLYHQWVAWAILIGSAIVDGLLYLLVGDVVICYRCGARHRGQPRETAHAPFDLGIAERYRQERLRREQLQAEQKP